MDDRSFRNLGTLHPRFQPEALAAWEEAQAAMPPQTQIVVIQGLRSFAESDALYAKGRTEPGPIVTKARAGQSYHNYGLAFDFEMLTDGKEDDTVGPLWLKVVAIMEAHGMQWGGHFPEGFHDNPHFENHYGLNWRALLAKYQAKDFIPGMQYVNL